MRRRLGLLVGASSWLAACSTFTRPPVQGGPPAAVEPTQREKPASPDAERLAAVRAKLELEVTELTGLPEGVGFTPAQAAEVAHLEVTPASDAYEARVMFPEPMRRPFAGGTLECTLEATPASVPVVREPDAGTKVPVAAAVKACAISEPRPATFRVADKVLSAVLTSFSPVGGAYIELKNLTAKPVTVSAASVTYFDQVASRSNLATQIQPRGEKTVTISAAFHKRLDWPSGGSAAAPEYAFGLSVTYATASGATDTLSGSDHIRASR
jgi:hypothetical protein